MSKGNKDAGSIPSRPINKDALFTRRTQPAMDMQESSAVLHVKDANAAHDASRAKALQDDAIMSLAQNAVDDIDDQPAKATPRTRVTMAVKDEYHERIYGELAHGLSRGLYTLQDVWDEILEGYFKDRPVHKAPKGFRERFERFGTGKTSKRKS